MNARTQPTNTPASFAGVRGSHGADPLSPRAQGLYDPTKEHNSCGVEP